MLLRHGDGVAIDICPSHLTISFAQLLCLQRVHTPARPNPFAACETLEPINMEQRRVKFESETCKSKNWYLKVWKPKGVYDGKERVVTRPRAIVHRRGQDLESASAAGSLTSQEAQRGTASQTECALSQPQAPYRPPQVLI